MIILKSMLRKWGDLDWMTQFRERWRAAVNAIINLHVRKKYGGFLD
jgi:hypothetical protein